MSATKIINCKILCTRYEVPCLLGKDSPLSFSVKDSESCWIAQEMLVDALVETGSPEFGLVAFKILALICCALCRTNKSTGNVAVGFWGFLGIARE